MELALGVAMIAAGTVQRNIAVATVADLAYVVTTVGMDGILDSASKAQ